VAGRAVLVVGALAASGATIVAIGWPSAAGARVARLLLSAAAIALVGALGMLAAALVTGDFALVYVADHSRRGASPWYRLAGLWGGMEGSLLLWTALLAIAAAVASWSISWRRSDPADPLVAAGTRPGATAADAVGRLTTAVLGALVAGFALTTWITADPFRTLQIPATDGGGLVPILEHPAMLIHPPLLYLGLVSTALPFALTVAALVTGRLDASWCTRARRWLLVSWVLLVGGLATGSNWAYVELGWGGYWAWDPIENTALLPWLAVTAALHQLLIRSEPLTQGSGSGSESHGCDAVGRPGRPSVADAALALLAWVLAVLGTLLTRSGAAVSVHAFAESDAVVVALLAVWLAVVVIAVGAVLVGRRSTRRTAPGDAVASTPDAGPMDTATAPVAPTRLIDRAGPLDRTLLLRAQTVLILAAVVLVAAGTVTPVVRAQLGGPASATTGDYFAAVTAPLVWVALALVTLAPALRPGERLRPAALEPLLRIPVLVGLAVAALVAAQGWTGARTLVTAGLASMAGASAVLRLTQQRRDGSGRAGSHVAHLGFAVLLLGFAGATAGSDRTVMIPPGETASVGGITVRNDDVRTDPGDGNPRVIATLTVERGSRSRVLEPEIIGYPTVGIRLAETALWSDPTGDVQIALRTADDDGRALVDIHVRPLTPLVWWGAALLIAGGLLALRRPRRAVSGADATTPPGTTGRGHPVQPDERLRNS